jgi:hypothetical protein
MPVAEVTVEPKRVRGALAARRRALRNAPFAVRITRRDGNLAATIYRRTLNSRRLNRLARLTAIGPAAFTAATPLLRAALNAADRAALNAADRTARFDPGPYLPIDANWGVRLACFGLVGTGLRDTSRLVQTARRLRDADATEASWWLGQMTSPTGPRAVRALRILLEAVP